jgi:hypothetical protein
MPATIGDIATGLKQALATVSGLRTYAYQPEQLSPPVAYPELTGVTYHRAFQGGDVVSNWNIGIVVGRYTDRTAHSLLDSYLSFSGAQSIRAAIEADKTLGGKVQTLILSQGARITALSVADAEYLQIEFTCEVHA